MTHFTTDMKDLAGLVRELKSLADRAAALAGENPAAERNLVAIVRHIEMLEIEICDPVEALSEDSPEGTE